MAVSRRNEAMQTMMQAALKNLRFTSYYFNKLYE